MEEEMVEWERQTLGFYFIHDSMLDDYSIFGDCLLGIRK
jgi:hypothetical protein